MLECVQYQHFRDREKREIRGTHIVRHFPLFNQIPKVSFCLNHYRRDILVLAIRCCLDKTHINVQFLGFYLTAFPDMLLGFVQCPPEHCRNGLHRISYYSDRHEIFYKITEN